MSIFSRLLAKHSQRVLLIDIGSSSVVAAVIEYTDEKPTVTYITSSDITVLTDLSFDQFEKEMEKALHETLKKMGNAVAPARIHIHLSSPWYASQVRIAKMARSTPFTVSKSMLNDMIARELKTFEDEELAAKKGSINALRALESKTLQVKLNGYTQENPIGLTAKEIELSLFVSVAPEALLVKVEEIVSRAFPHKTISFASFLGAAFVVSRDVFVAHGEYLLVDIGGEVTDVSLVRGGSLIQSVSFPQGRNFILRRLSQGLSRTIEESVALCNLYVEGKIEDSLQESCTKILGVAKNEWLASFQKALFSVSNELSIPDTILLTSHQDVAPWFVETIRREEFHQYTLTEKEFKVVLLDAELFHQSFSFAEGVKRDPFIMIGALAHSRHVNTLEN